MCATKHLLAHGDYCAHRANRSKLLILESGGNFDLFTILVNVGKHEVCGAVVHFRLYVLPINEAMLLYTSQSLVLPRHCAEKYLTQKSHSVHQLLMA